MTHQFYIYYEMGGLEPEKFEIRAATSGSLQGPYTDNGHVLTDCEHNRDDDGQQYFFYSRDFTSAEYLVYQAWDADMKVRQVCIDKLIWAANGPSCPGPTYTPQPFP